MRTTIGSSVKKWVVVVGGGGEWVAGVTRGGDGGGKGDRHKAEAFSL